MKKMRIISVAIFSSIVHPFFLLFVQLFQFDVLLCTPFIQLKFSYTQLVHREVDLEMVIRAKQLVSNLWISNA